MRSWLSFDQTKNATSRISGQKTRFESKILENDLNFSSRNCQEKGTIGTVAAIKTRTGIRIKERYGKSRNQGIGFFSGSEKICNLLASSKMV